VLALLNRVFESAILFLENISSDLLKVEEVMKKKGKLKIISWISTIAMILSIFNIPLVGYATNGTEEGTESDVSYSVYAEVLDENYDINETVVTAESGHSVTGNYFNDNDGVPYRVFRITGIDSEGENVVFSESNSIVVTSGGPRVAKVADGDGFDGTVDDASESVSVTPAGTSPCFCVYFMGNGGTNITVEIDGETLMTFPISVDLTTCDVCGEYTCICESGEEGDDDGICDYCGKSIEDECVCGSAEYCDVCGETIENCTCGTDEIDLDSFGIRVDDDYGYQNVYDDGVCIEGFKGEDITRQFEIYYNDIDNDAVPKGTITVSSSNTDVALITTYEQPVGENSAVDERTSPASIPSAGDCTTQYFDLICVGTGTSTISLSYTPEGGDTSLIKSFPVEVVCNASIESLDIKYTLAGDSGEYTETIYFEGADYASVTLRPYDSDKDVYITGSDIAGNKIEELVEFEDGRYSIWLSAKSSDGNESKTYYVVIKEPTNPFVEITYYHDGKEKVKPVYFDDDPRPGISLPYGYDSSKAVTAEVTHLDGTVSNHSVFWEDSSTGLIRFTSNVGGEEFTYNVDVWVQDPSNDNDCDIYIKAYDDEGGYRENYIDWQAASEGGTTVTIPYGFSDRVELYAVPYSEYASLEGFYLDGEQELGYILVSDGDTRTFDVIAQSGDRKTYKLTFVESDGTNADVDVSANIYDLNLENSDFGGYRDIDIEFSENNNVKTADVVLPYYYDNEYGIRLDFESDDSYSLAIDEEYKEWEGDRGYLSEDGTATVEYSITSPDGKTTKEYKR